MVPTGCLTGGSVWLDGTHIHLPSYAASKTNNEKVVPILNTTKAAIPQHLRDAVFCPLGH